MAGIYVLQGTARKGSRSRSTLDTSPRPRQHSSRRECFAPAPAARPACTAKPNKAGHSGRAGEGGGNEVTGPFGPDRQRWTARYGRAALHCTCRRPRGAMGVGMHELTTPRGSSTGPPASFPAPSISHRLIAVAGRLLIPESFLPRPHGVAYAPGGPRRQNASCHVQFFLNPGARR